MSPFAAGAAKLVELLLRSSLQGALLIAAVWLACRLMPRLPAAVRCGLWWAACLKLLVGLVWIAPVELPLLPPAVDSTGVLNRTVSGAAAALTSPALLSQRERREKNGEQTAFPSLPLGERGQGSEGAMRLSRIDLSRTAVVGILLFAWLAGLAFQSLKALRQLRYTHWVIARSRPVREGWIRAAFAELCALLALRRPPALRGSADVRTPQALGPLRPLVLLPESGLARLSEAEVSMTLCHELVHLRRGDLWLGWVPALAHRIFFFHPLAALAAREYAIAREAACDAEVLRLLGSAPQAYGRLLLRWGVAPRETGLAAAGASPSLHNLKRRLQMLQQTSANKRRLSGWWWLAGAAVIVALIPLRIVAQEPAPEAAPAVAEAPAPPAVTAEAPAVAAGIPGGVEGGVVGGVQGGIPGGVEGGVPGGVEGGVVGGVAGGVKGGVAGALASGAPLPAVPGSAPVAVAAPSAGPTPALAPLAPGAPAVAARPGTAPVAVAVAALPSGPPRAQAVPAPPAPRAHAAPPAPPAPLVPPVPPAPPAPPKHGFGYSFHTSNGGGDSWVLLYGNGSSTMSGSSDDLEKATRLRGSSKEDILWFRHGGKEYVVRDAAVLKQAKELFGPQMELGKKQGELGARQGALGARQGALGAKQGALGGKQGALGAQMAALAAQQAGGDKDDASLEKRQSELEAQMDELGRQQEELGKQQEELGRQQEELGRQQEELGRRQEAAGAKAEKEFQSLMEQAIRSGAAQPVKS